MNGKKEDYNSEGTSLEEPLLPGAETQAKNSNETEAEQLRLVIVFVAYVLFGSIVGVLQKLIAIPMFNYANFLNFWGTLVFCIQCSFFVIPALYFSSYLPESMRIPMSQTKLSKRPFAIMGSLDYVSLLLRILASVQLSGPLLVLLPQTGIPISMVLSACLLNKKYSPIHWIGAVTVLLGIGIVVGPMFSNSDEIGYSCIASDNEKYCTICEQVMTEDECVGVQYHDPSSFEQSFIFSGYTMRDVNESQNFDGPCRWESSDNGDASLTFFWSVAVVFAMIPMALSSIYKESYSQETEIDPIYWNLWIAIFQTFYSLLFAVPTGYISEPRVPADEFFSNFWDGFKCTFGYSSLDTGCHPDHCHLWGPLFFWLYQLTVFGLAISMIVLLKYGGANLMFLGSTLILPISNLAFALPFMPNATAVHFTDILGLCVILFGLGLYKYAASFDESEEGNNNDDYVSDSTEPLSSESQPEP